jgi:four helix bundle protein
VLSVECLVFGVECLVLSVEEDSVEKHKPIEEMDFFRSYESIAKWARDSVEKWTPFRQDTVGKQLVRSLDSIGANLVEGDGRFSYKDGLSFLTIARASAREGKLWLERACDRKLLDPAIGAIKIHELVEATKALNGLITFRRNRNRTSQVREPRQTYGECDDNVFTFSV